MGLSRGRGLNAGHFYSNLVSPIKVECQFVVNSTDSGGYGITSLKSNGYVQNVFMNTSATGAAASVGNPIPLAGFALVKLNANYNTYVGGSFQIQPPNAGSDIAVGSSSLTIGQAYVVTVLGTTTTAEWVACGLPAGVTPTVGQGFIAKATGSGSGSGKVKVPGVSGVVAISVVGNPTLESMNSNLAANGGAQVVLQMLGATNSSTTTLIPVAPAAGSVISVSMIFDQSSVTVDGL